MADRRHALARLTPSPRAIPAAEMALLPEAAKVSLRARPAAIDTAERALGIELPAVACRFNVRGNRTAYWLGPDEWLLTASGDDPMQLFTTMQASLAGQSCSLVDVSHRSDAFAISGPRAAYVVNHGCPLDLSLTEFPVGMCTRTLIGKASVLLSRPQEDAFHIDVWRSFAPYVWQLLDEARGELE